MFIYIAKYAVSWISLFYVKIKF